MGKGKEMAVRTGFSDARGKWSSDSDADTQCRSSPAEYSTPRFESGQGEFITWIAVGVSDGKRGHAIPHIMCNGTFSKLFSWLVNQRFTGYALRWHHGSFKRPTTSDRGQPAYYLARWESVSAHFRFCVFVAARAGLS